MTTGTVRCPGTPTLENEAGDVAPNEPFGASLYGSSQPVVTYLLIGRVSDKLYEGTAWSISVHQNFCSQPWGKAWCRYVLNDW